ncbi:MAG: nucleoside-diphosphate sugar epimerase/dehydratase [Ignavibacteriales bacterium]|nr:nucleoside-diphosphate sugar epimerase/dehydratase [Ignavibacteriales bacterium]
MNKEIKDSINYSNFQRKLTFIFFDLAAFTASLLISVQIRFEFSSIGAFNTNFLPLLFIFLIVKTSMFFYFRLYDISWRFVSLHDLANIGKACLFSNGILFIVIYGIPLELFKGFPRIVLLVDLVLSFLFSSGLKISKRMYLEVIRRHIGNSYLKKAIIVGAGSTGEQLLRDWNRNQNRKIYPIGFVDDDLNKQNLYMQGIRVLGTTDELQVIIRQYNIESIIIAVLTADRAFHKKILKLAREAGVHDVKVVSTINDTSNLIQVSVQDVRDLDVSDLIGRQAVSINTQEISGYIKGKRVLITGAAGSIGSEISRQVNFYHPSCVGILDINESDVAGLELELKFSFPDLPVKMFLCDVSNNDKVNKIFREFKPDVVFHAAAYKHVPVMEKFPEEAVRVNIIGTYNLAKAAVEFGSQHFVLISTDKAVNPSSIMGVTKRIAEIIVTNAGFNSKSHFVAVRFGNVIGSRGSVLPIFLDQIKRGGPLTITHPDMKRYFMTTSESVALVLQAAATGKNGDIFVLDMGEPVKIVDLARELIILNNLEPDKDIKIIYTGIREGEKLFEEILTAEEGVDSTKHEKIFKARMSKSTVCNLSDLISEFSHVDNGFSKADWLDLFKKYVPSFISTGDQKLFFLGDSSKPATVKRVFK